MAPVRDRARARDDPGRRRGPRRRIRRVRAAGAGRARRSLRRSIHVRHIDCGSDGSEEWEIQALWNPYYDIQRLGFFLTNAPRHADVLLVTGPVTAPMRAPLERTWQVMPEPKALVAVGTDACGGGLRAGDRGDRASRRAGSTRSCPLTSMCPVRRRRRSRSCTASCWPPGCCSRRRPHRERAVRNRDGGARPGAGAGDHRQRPALRAPGGGLSAVGSSCSWSWASPRRSAPAIRS